MEENLPEAAKELKKNQQPYTTRTTMEWLGSRP